MAAIIETNDNRFFKVQAAGGTPVAYWGIEVKKVRGDWIAKKNAQSRLIRKSCTRIVQDYAPPLTFIPAY